MDGIDAGARRQVGLRHAAGARRPVVRRHAAAAVGLVRPVRAAAREPAAVDGYPGQPRGGGGPYPAAAGLAAPVRRLRRAVADAVRGERVGVQPLLLFRRGRRRRPRRDAGLVRLLQLQLGPVRVAGAGPRGRRPARDAMARGAAARALVQHERGAPGGGRGHEEGHGAAAVRGPRRRRLRRPCPCLRTLHKGVTRQTRADPCTSP
uniref:Uncharacterized protein n=1 Tax=Arundo donax TaxID=35708 RepID=A0A0A9DWH7_ARUDO